MSRTFSVKLGSVLMLKYSIRWGLRPKVLQIRETVDCDTPATLAISVVDQPVAFIGSVVVVRRMISVIFSSSWVLGVPERGASERTETPKSEKRLRYFATVNPEAPENDMMSLWLRPSAAPGAILARVT